MDVPERLQPVAESARAKVQMGSDDERVKRLIRIWADANKKLKAEIYTRPEFLNA